MKNCLRLVFVALWMLLQSKVTSAQELKGTLFMSHGVASSLDNVPQACSFDGNLVMLDKINSAPRCGVHVDGKNYSLMLNVYDNEISGDKNVKLLEALNPSTDVWLGTY
eukprot:6974086-Ditylum_brightwellii.AAC.1